MRRGTSRPVFRAAALVLLPVQILWGAPLEAALAKGVPAPPAPPAVTVNRKLPRMDPGPGPLSASPSAAEIGRQRFFEEPLAPVGGAPSADENRALAGVLRSRSLGAVGRAPIRAFLAANPGSPWRASLLTNLGIMERRAGAFTQALESWETAWTLARGESDPAASAVADRALGELLDLHLTFGHLEALETKLEEIGGRDVHGSAAQKVSRAREAVWILRYHHEDALPSARTALSRLLAAAQRPVPAEVAAMHGTPEGMTLDELQGTAARVGLPITMAFRSAGSSVPLPAIVHLKVGHYSAVLKEQGGAVLLDDPVLGGQLWMSREVLDQESSGYFLIPKGKLDAGWREVKAAEASGIRGKCVPTLYNTQQMGPCTPQSGGNSNCGGSGPPMAVHSVNTLAASLSVTDTPVGYTPPRGPAVRFHVNYNQREAAQPQTFSYSNLGRNWTLDWLSYVTDDPTAPQPSGGTVYLRGAGGETFSPINGVGTSTPHLYSKAVMARTSLSPIRYERRLPDGSLEVFDLSDGASPRRVFLTKVVDPQGQALTFTYDGTFRLVAATDAIGQVTTVSYELPADPLKVTKVTDPFGRFATFEYNGGGQLTRITDVGGIQSSFTYGPADAITSETTPYGTHHFDVGEGEGMRWVTTTDPLGGTERVEYDYLVNDQPPETPPAGMVSDTALLAGMNSYYWDKRAMALHRDQLQHAQAEVTHFMRERTLHQVSGVPHSTKRPLENRVWYNYAGSDASGGRDLANETRPSIIGRTLDDGSAQLTRFEYNDLDNVTRETDPLGRETLYEYAPNGIDVLRIKQKNPAGAGGYDLLASATYNGQYEPLTSTDASGQTTALTYNAAGQLQTATNAKNEIWTLVYDTSGYLQTISGPIPGTTLSLTYDGYVRPRTVTNFEGYTVTVDYDVFDRPTRASFPNGTYEQVVYDRLHPSQFRDLLGRWSRLFVDALGRPTSFQDPLGRTITLQWCGCGALEKLLDGNGHATRWERDDQGRVIREIRADDTVRSRTFETTTSRVKTITDAKGQVRTYSYFRDDRLQSVTYSNAAIPTPAVSFTFDPVYGRVATRTDGTGTTAYSFNPIASPPALGAGRLATIDGPLANDLVGYTYDELGRPLSRNIAGQATSVLYDVLGRVTNVTNVLGAFTYGYDGNTSRVASVASPGGLLRSYEYFDQAGDHQLRRITNQVGSNVLSRFTYGYNAQNQIATWTQQQGADSAKRYELSYDSADQLTSAILKDDATGAILKRYGYAYDQSYNRTSEQIDDVLTSTFHNVVDELTSRQAGGAVRFAGSTNEPATVTVQGKLATTTPANDFSGTGAATAGVNTVAVTATDSTGNVRTNTYNVTVTGGASGTLTYDANGSLTSDGTRTYEWNGADRLTAINQGTHRTEFTYDGVGRRARIVEKDNGAITSDNRALWIGNSMLEERDAAGGAVTKRLFGQGVQQGSTNLFYAKDHLGSIRELVDTTGTARAEYSFEPFGRRTKASGDLDADAGFAGTHEHDASGLSLARYRGYDPGSGRWLKRDPIGLAGGINLYAYTGNDPVNRIDPLGLSWAAFGSGLVNGLGTGLVVGAIIGFGLGALAGTALLPFVAIGLAAWGAWNLYKGLQVIRNSCSEEEISYLTGQLIGGTIGGSVGGGAGFRAGAAARSTFPGVRSSSLPDYEPIDPDVYDPRVYGRMGQDPGPNHNFPTSFDDTILQNGQLAINKPGYQQYNQPGTINNQGPGNYQIGVNTITGQISHRVFCPLR